MSDLISRQAAIDAIRKVDDYGDGIAFEVLSHAQRDISLLPSAERRGRWTTERTMEHDGEWYCSVCGYEPIVYEATNYCPNCGARMEVE